MVGGSSIPVKSTMKYLGIVLDGKWRFTEHFRQLAPKLVAFAGVLSGLLPNLRGPNKACRRLYCGVLRSKALYGAPVWADAINWQTRAMLRRPQRAIAQRAARAYCTVSFDAACLLAGTPPWDLDAEVLAASYRRKTETRANGVQPLPEEIKRWREMDRDGLLRKWSERLERPTAGHELVGAVQPILSDWVLRGHGELTFHLAQVLSGHGCFGRYLCRVVGREPTDACHHCGAEEDTAHHTRAECPSWAEPRAELVAAIGADLSLAAMAKAMVDSEEKWLALATFAETVMVAKETAERERESNALSLPIRRKRPGRRRLAYARSMPP